MEIKELRKKLNLSQREFASKLNIPLGTLRNWEQELTSPPDYVLDLILNSVKEDFMLNHETIKFISMLEKLARLSKNGIDRFENATEENYYSMVFYDASKADSNGLYRIVLDAIYHPYDSSPDIISYYDSDTSDYSVRVNADDEEDVFIVVSFPDQSYQIVIEEGKWYAV